MPVPAFRHFIEPLLRLLAQHLQGIEVSRTYETLADKLGLTEQDRAELLPSQTQPVYKNRIGWAHDRLKRKGWSSSPQRGIWRITDEGRRFVETHPQPLTEAEVDELANIQRGSRIPMPSDTNDSSTSTVLGADEQASPEELIEHGLQDLQESVARDLMERIMRCSPRFFEMLVLDLLHAMGYGTNRKELEHVGGSGDGGIDGIISLDRLGLEKVFVQAKRWKDRVGRPQIQAFYGALAGRRANKGVFITTSGFSLEAIEFARQVERIVLVDGNELTLHMIEHGVGISHKVLRIPKIDSDYFEGD